MGPLTELEYFLKPEKLTEVKRIFKPAKRVNKCVVALREVVLHAREIEKTGKEVLKLNIGDPNKFDFDTPSHIRKALRDAVENQYNFYAPAEGLPEFKEAVARREKKINNVEIDPEKIVATSGVSEGIIFVASALLNPGEEILVPGPTYSPYEAFTRYMDGNPIPYSCDEENAWQPEIDDLRKKITEKTKALLIINPNNPTGALYDKKTMKKMIDIAGEYNLLVLSDEIYDLIVYEEQRTSTASLSKDVPVLGLNGFSKVYLAPGWRMAYIYLHDPPDLMGEIWEGILKVARARLSACTPLQKACVTACDGPHDFVQEMLSKLRKRRDYTTKRLNEIEGISCVEPRGAFYAFPHIHDLKGAKTDKEFVLKILKEKQVLFVHGSGFGKKYGKNHFRTVFLPPIEILEEAFNRLEEFMQSR